MDVAKTLRHKIINQARIFEDTLIIYNDALSFIMEVIDKEFESLEGYSTQSMVTAVEKLIHTTKLNPLPTYNEFNSRFYKYPSYLRRSTIAAAFGKVKSFRSNYRNWETERELALSEGNKFKKNPPRLQLQHKEFPVI